MQPQLSLLITVYRYNNPLSHTLPSHISHISHHMHSYTRTHNHNHTHIYILYTHTRSQTYTHTHIHAPCAGGNTSGRSLSTSEWLLVPGGSTESLPTRHTKLVNPLLLALLYSPYESLREVKPPRRHTRLATPLA